MGAASFKHGQAKFNLSASLAAFRRRSGIRWPGGWWLATSVDTHFDLANVLEE